MGQQPELSNEKSIVALKFQIAISSDISKKDLGELLSRTQNRDIMVKIGSQVSYKHTRTEDSDVWHNEVHKNVSNHQGSSLANRQYSIALSYL